MTMSNLKKVASNKVEDRTSRKIERKELVSAALVMLIWRKFLARQKQLLEYLALPVHSFVGCAVVAKVDESMHSRCLNETRSAISAKLEAASQLSSAGLFLTNLVLNCQPDESCLVEKLMQRKSSLWLGVFRHFQRCTMLIMAC